MGCIQDETLLERYLDSELSEPMMLRVTEALDTCEHCRVFVQEMEAIRVSLRTSLAEAVEAAPLDDLWTRIESRIDEEDSAPQETSNGRARLLAWILPRRLEFAMSTAAAAVAIVLGTWIINVPGPTNRIAPGVAVTKPEVDNTLIVVSVEVRTGNVIIDNDPENKLRPTVVWHIVDDEQDGS